MRHISKYVLLVALSLLVSSNTWAGGLYIPEDADGTSVGYGGVNFIARADGANTVFANPAGMTRFKESEFLLAATGLVLKANFSTDEDNTIDGPSRSADEIIATGNFGYIRPISDKLSFGLSAHNYFGLGLNWRSEWVGRYVSTQAIIIAPQIQPTLAYKLNDEWSIGGGIGVTLGYLKDKKKIAGNLPGDGSFRYEDTDIAFQPNVSFMYEPSENTRIAVRYLGETELKFRDKPKAELADGSPLGGNTGTLELGMNMPQAINAGIWQKVSERWAVLGSVAWEDWSRLGRVSVDIVGNDIPEQVAAIATEDTWHFGIGGEYQATPKMIYTMGASWDSSWQRDKNRVANVPIGAVWRLGGGIKYEKSEDLTWGGGLSVFYEGDLPIADVDTGTNGNLSGEYTDVVLYWASFYGKWR